MSDLFADMMSMSAASSASEAASESKKARQASEEHLEASGHNPFISFEVSNLSMDYEGSTFWEKLFGTGKRKLLSTGTVVSIKKTDISHLSQHFDDFKTVYTLVHLESRCNLDKEYIMVFGSTKEVQNYINNQ